MRARHVHLEAQRGLVADVLDLIQRAVRHLHHEALGRDHGLAAFDGEPERAGLHDPPLARVAVHAPRRLRARRHRDPLREQALVVDHRFGPVRFARVPREHVGELGVRPVHAGPAGGFRLRREHRERRFLAGDRLHEPDSGYGQHRGERPAKTLRMCRHLHRSGSANTYTVALRTTGRSISGVSIGNVIDCAEP
ncbi:MAG TPA: hypothetical protein VE907_05455 [Gammaproteobacteria bacterium]|nr:hypothetical protein [Gammaproteobacteria bacterium]